MKNSAVKVFKALSDETRFAIVKDFLNGHTSVCPEIKNELAKSQPTLSHHIGILKDAGVILETKAGVNCHYKIDNHFLLSLGIDLTRLSAQKDK